MKKTYTRFISLFLAFAASIILFPAAAFAGDGDGSDGVHMNKGAVYDPTSKEGTITLESFVEGTIKTISKATPADIVLVLDCTESLSNDNFTKLRNAASSFVNSISEAATENSVNHRVAIITIAAPQDLVCDFTSCTGTGLTTLTNKISGLPKGGGATRQSEALNWANVLFNGVYASDMLKSGSLTSHYTYQGKSTKPASLVGPQKDASKFIVMFTDGKPDDNNNVAINSIAIAKEFKQAGITIYCVGLLDGLSTTAYTHNYEGCSMSNTERDYCRSFLNAVSSNYPTAESSFVSLGSGKYKLLDTEMHDYCLEVTASETLEKIFMDISKEIKEAVPSITLGTEVTLKDFINRTYFKLPENATPGDIKTYTANFTGIKDGKYTFDLANKTPVALTVTIDRDPDGNDYVSIKGFNFSANFCAVDESGVPNGGKEVVVEIPFVFNGIEQSGELETNNDDSGIYNPPVPVVDPETGDPVIDPETGEPVMEPEEKIDPYPVPTIKFCTLNIVRYNLLRGETAIYSVVYNKNNKEVCKVALSSSEDGEVIIESIAGLPEGTYTVTETPWNWAYEKAADPGNNIELDAGGNPYKIVVCEYKTGADGKEVATLASFYGAHIHTTDETAPAEMHNHDESFVDNKMVLPKN